jgi:uncharacterized protein YdiU (UPF0061 family)
MDKPVADLKLSWRLEDSYRRLPANFYTTLPSDRPGTEPLLVHASADSARLVGLDPDIVGHPDFPKIFAGHLPVPGFESFATVYAGHQFGTWVPQLGDGRALTIAQVRTPANDLWDVQLKGAGRTPYSRFADGRAVMQSSIREYLCSEAMAGLGVPTTRALALVATQEEVARERYEPGAVVTRLLPSNIRFGHFEFFAHRGQTDDLKLLVDYVIETYFADLAGVENPYAAWFADVVARTARMIAAWQAVGFAHGVMNTDNMSILGVTLDYGPFGFLDTYEPGFICNHSDDGGRYAFEQQPGIGLWNCHALAQALTSLIAVDDLKAALGAYEETFRAHLVALMAPKFGFAELREGDVKLMNRLLTTMKAGKADYTLTFRGLGRVGDPEGASSWLSLFGAARADAAAWLSDYLVRLEVEPLIDRSAQMDTTNPKFVLRNWVAETSIRAIEDRGDVATLHRIFKAVTAPFDEHVEAQEFSAAPPPSMCGLSVSCSS